MDSGGEKNNPTLGKERIEKSKIAQREERVLEFWQKNKIFEKTEAREARQEFVFYDGPPFATGLPHYGHVLNSAIKDAIPRYQSMLGKRVRRVWGWDCHGLPLENLIEKELNLKTKKDIEDLGIGKFNEAARSSVLRYENEWKKIIPRIGRWIDMEHAYKTMDSTYTESVWWVFETLYKKGLVEKGFKSMHLCPRCETTLSNFEVNQGYKDISDISVYAKFELADEPSTFLLAWTTTPWTLPGNVALAVNPKVEYVKIRITNDESGLPGQGIKSEYILAKERLLVLKEQKYEVLREFKGSELVGKKYKPVFDYYVNTNLVHKDHAWKVYGADFVTTTDGTGIVHIAPAFGADDLALSRREHLPLIHHVGTDGKFKKEVTDFAGQSVKPKDDHQKADIEIIKNLAHRGLLFAKEKIVHPYPHCWRCETPLLNYAASSWFVKVPKIKDTIIAENKKVHWIPEDLRDGRFGKWLEGAPDWAISRSRYWGAPLPVWECRQCEKKEILGSLEDIRKKTSRGNKYFVMRHGQAENNISNIVSSDPDNNKHHITEVGRKQIHATAKKLIKEKIDLIFTSPFARTRETAELAGELLQLPASAIHNDDRIREVNAGEFSGKSMDEYHAFFASFEERFTKSPKQGENFTELKNRTTEFLFDIDSQYQGKNILIISHDSPLWLLSSGAEGLNMARSLEIRGTTNFFLENAEVRPVDFRVFPHNKNYELDFHRPYIDEITFPCSCGAVMTRVPEVFDCWFESGAMPYGQYHYPFESGKGGKFQKMFDPEKDLGFPADFIAEGLDQTRGWFYSLLVLGTALYGRVPYKHVLVNGIVLAEDGRKMAKSLKNYPDLMEVVNTYGADALRFYLLSSPATHAEDLNFFEKGVDEVLKKVIMRLENVYSFYALYQDKQELKVLVDVSKSKNVLDAWILARLSELVTDSTNSLDKYELDRASRPIVDFIDDLSTWYLRRSRDRFKGEDKKDKESALAVTQFILRETAKVLAPFGPFFAEDLYQKVKGENGKESVHLELWPGVSSDFAIDSKKLKLLENMKEVRKIVTHGLEARAAASIKVRQPLQQLKVKSGKIKLGEEFLDLVKDEVNVKEVVYDKNISGEVELDVLITPELKSEGDARDLIRNIQELRKDGNLLPSDLVTLFVDTDEAGKKLIEKYTKEISKTTGLTKIEFTALEGDITKIDTLVFKLKLQN